MEKLPRDILLLILEKCEEWQTVQFARLSKHFYRSLISTNFFLQAKKEHDLEFGSFSRCSDLLRQACLSDYKDKVLEYMVRDGSSAIPTMVASYGKWDIFKMLILYFPDYVWWEMLFPLLIRKGKLEGIKIAIEYGDQSKEEGLKIYQTYQPDNPPYYLSEERYKERLQNRQAVLDYLSS